MRASRKYSAAICQRQKLLRQLPGDKYSISYADSSLKTFPNDGLERFLANVGVMPDGGIVSTIASPLDINDRAVFIPHLWGSEFGACLRLLLRTSRVPLQAVFIPGEKAFDALKSNRIAFASYRMGRIQSISEYDLSLSTEARSAFETLIARCQTAHGEIEESDRAFISADLIRANSVSASYFSKHWTRLEWLQRGWINECGMRYRHAISLVKERHDDLIFATNMPELQEHFDLFHETFSILTEKGLSTSSKIQKVITAYKSRQISELLIEGITFDNEQTLLNAEASLAFKRARSVAFELWNLLE